MTRLIMLIWMKLIGVEIGSKSRIKGLFLVMKRRSSNIRIGDNFSVNSSFFSNLIGLYQRTIIIARKNGSIELGNHVGVSCVTIHGSDIKIGDYAVIGANTKILDHDFHAINYSERRIDDQTNVKTKPVKIGNDVFIGCNCLIVKGTVIGDRSVIEAGSVVSGVFPADSIIAGNPARVIKSGESNYGKKQ